MDTLFQVFPCQLEYISIEIKDGAKHKEHECPLIDPLEAIKQITITIITMWLGKVRDLSNYHSCIEKSVLGITK